MAEHATLPQVRRQPSPKQSAAETAAVYAYVTARDVSCRAPAIVQWDMGSLFWTREDCSYPSLERHHAFTGTGSKRITDARHVVLLCRWHHANWAPSHSRLILAWLDHVETARERARLDFDDGVPA